MPNVLFLPECYADTALIQFLLSIDAEIDHVFGIHNVAKQMQLVLENRPDLIVVGIIDKDKENTPTAFDAFQLVAQWERITLKSHPQYKQHLIILDKAIETFIQWNAEQVGVLVTSYGFPENLRQFCKVFKRTTIGADPSYLQLLAELHIRQAPGFLTLERILNDITTT